MANGFYSRYTNKIYAWGVKLVLCGETVTPKKVAECLNCGKDMYSTCLVYDAKGNLSEVRYEKIREVFSM